MFFSVGLSCKGLKSAKVRATPTKSKKRETIVEGQRLRTVHIMERTCSRHRHVDEDVDVYVYVHVYVFVHVYLWVYTYIYIYIYKYLYRDLGSGCAWHASMIRGTGPVLFSTNSQTFEWVRS